MKTYNYKGFKFYKGKNSYFVGNKEDGQIAPNDNVAPQSVAECKAVINSWLKVPKIETYLCKCNKCDSILFDENPGENSVLIDITSIDKPINHMIQLRDDSGLYWACPNCSTDSYLMDILDNDF